MKRRWTQIKARAKKAFFSVFHPRSWAANCSLAYSLTYPNLAGWGLVIGDDLAPFGGLVSDDWLWGRRFACRRQVIETWRGVFRLDASTHFGSMTSTPSPRRSAQDSPMRLAFIADGKWGSPRRDGSLRMTAITRSVSESGHSRLIVF